MPKIGDKYWYQIIREFCDMCGEKIGESRIRVYDKKEATKEDLNIPVCNKCWRSMKL